MIRWHLLLSELDCLYAITGIPNCIKEFRGFRVVDAAQEIQGFDAGEKEQFDVIRIWKVGQKGSSSSEVSPCGENCDGEG